MTRLKMNTIFIIIIAILFSSLSIGYSALSGSVKITGTTSYQHIVTASNLSYSNSTSGLSATTAQAAIDELNSRLNTARLSNIKRFYVHHLADDSTTIQGVEAFKYEDGMDWYDFLVSQYNDNGFYNGRGYIIHTNTELYLRDSDHIIIEPTDYIFPETYFIIDDSCCFDPETLVTIDFDGNTKKIKDLEVGDTIVVENVNTKEKHLTTVLKDASEHPKTFDFTEITLESGTKLKFNSYHPIYTTEGYKSVTNYNNYPTLEIGDYALTSKNEKKKIIKINRYSTSKPEMTYNLLIKGIEEFYLEEEYAYIANNTLVHTGIAEYDDEDEWREKNRYKCIQQEIYKDFNYDQATEEELIKYLVELKVSNEDAFNEYIKYYISADQYYRYAKVARTIKEKAKELENNNYLHYTTKNKTNHLKNNS